LYLKERLREGQCLIGAGIYSSSPDIMEYSAGGMDWIWWDCQHTHSDWQMTLHAVRTGCGMGIPVIIRTWTHCGDTIERLLDTGAEGVIVPMVDTVEQAEDIVSRCYYPPVGRRSFGSLRTEFMEPSTDEWNRRVVVVLTIETPLAIENAEAIARVDGVDALLLGSADLALRRGHSPGLETSHASVEADLALMKDACDAAGKTAAVITPTTAAISQRLEQGYRLICAGFDVDHAASAFGQMRKEFDRVTGTKGTGA
jgi:4-hydroxy-2-oxoheptanedioate aldolase